MLPRVNVGRARVAMGRAMATVERSGGRRGTSDVKDKRKYEIFQAKPINVIAVTSYTNPYLSSAAPEEIPAIPSAPWGLGVGEKPQMFSRVGEEGGTPRIIESGEATLQIAGSDSNADAEYQGELEEGEEEEEEIPSWHADVTEELIEENVRAVYVGSAAPSLAKTPTEAYLEAVREAVPGGMDTEFNWEEPSSRNQHLQVEVDPSLLPEIPDAPMPLTKGSSRHELALSTREEMAATTEDFEWEDEESSLKKRGHFLSQVNYSLERPDLAAERDVPPSFVMAEDLAGYEEVIGLTQNADRKAPEVTSAEELYKSFDRRKLSRDTYGHTVRHHTPRGFGALRAIARQHGIDSAGLLTGVPREIGMIAAPDLSGVVYQGGKVISGPGNRGGESVGSGSSSSFPIGDLGGEETLDALQGMSEEEMKKLGDMEVSDSGEMEVDEGLLRALEGGDVTQEELQELLSSGALHIDNDGKLTQEEPDNVGMMKELAEEMAEGREEALALGEVVEGGRESAVISNGSNSAPSGISAAAAGPLAAGDVPAPRGTSREAGIGGLTVAQRMVAEFARLQAVEEQEKRKSTRAEDEELLAIPGSVSHSVTTPLPVAVDGEEMTAAPNPLLYPLPKRVDLLPSLGHAKSLMAKVDAVGEAKLFSAVDAGRASLVMQLPPPPCQELSSDANPRGINQSSWENSPERTMSPFHSIVLGSRMAASYLSEGGLTVLSVDCEDDATFYNGAASEHDPDFSPFPSSSGAFDPRNPKPWVGPKDRSQLSHFRKSHGVRMLDHALGRLAAGEYESNPPGTGLPDAPRALPQNSTILGLCFYKASLTDPTKSPLKAIMSPSIRAGQVMGGSPVHPYMYPTDGNVPRPADWVLRTLLPQLTMEPARESWWGERVVPADLVIQRIMHRASTIAVCLHPVDGTVLNWKLINSRPIIHTPTAKE